MPRRSVALDQHGAADGVRLVPAPLEPAVLRGSVLSGTVVVSGVSVVSARRADLAGRWWDGVGVLGGGAGPGGLGVAPASGARVDGVGGNGRCVSGAVVSTAVKSRCRALRWNRLADRLRRAVGSGLVSVGQLAGRRADVLEGDVVEPATRPARRSRGWRVVAAGGQHEGQRDDGEAGAATHRRKLPHHGRDQSAQMAVVSCRPVVTSKPRRSRSPIGVAGSSGVNGHICGRWPVRAARADGGGRSQVDPLDQHERNGHRGVGAAGCCGRTGDARRAGVGGDHVVLGEARRG